jgi:hypothetical protein
MGTIVSGSYDAFRARQPTTTQTSPTMGMGPEHELPPGQSGGSGNGKRRHAPDRVQTHVSEGSY